MVQFMNKRRIFRALVCFLMICCILINCSPMLFPPHERFRYKITNIYTLFLRFGLTPIYTTDFR